MKGETDEAQRKKSGLHNHLGETRSVPTLSSPTRGGHAAPRLVLAVAATGSHSGDGRRLDSTFASGRAPALTPARGFESERRIGSVSEVLEPSKVDFRWGGPQDVTPLAACDRVRAKRLA
jgi:hypothetical protein